VLLEIELISGQFATDDVVRGRLKMVTFSLRHPGSRIQIPSSSFLYLIQNLG
jgi:hypothetical protein